MAPPTAGYSGTPLARVLDIVAGSRAVALHAPDDYLSSVPTHITEDVIRELALPIGVVDVKVCAVSAVWSGLKLVIRRELRGQPNGGV